MKNIETNSVFKFSSENQVICPPEQVFSLDHFQFLLTIGGDLIDNEIEYERLRIVLKELGEDEFYILENLNATLTDRTIPFKTSISLDKDYNYFQQIVRAFDPPFGWTINHFYVFGKSERWGIYICEWPTINIIGCEPTLSEKFRSAFSIHGNGYSELEDFIVREFQFKKELIEKFIKNYKC